MNEMKKLLEVMSQLRDPEAGCPWDLAQDYHSIAPCTIEEAYEVVDAIERGDMDELCDELGDLLFQVVFYAQIAKEEGRFDFAQVAEKIAEKLIRRHPHVFGDADVEASDHRATWEKIKADERREKGVATKTEGVLNGVAVTLPALTRAVKLQKRAAHVGFDWPDIEQVLDKVQEELDEVREVLVQNQGDLRMRHEVGDLLQAVSNLARHAEIDPETALREANQRFEHRFSHIETQCVAQGVTPQSSSLASLEAMWVKAKLAE
jgi:ATP diphosphatase